MNWMSTKEYIVALYEEYIEKTVHLMNHKGLEGTLDKIKWGIPFQSKPTIWKHATPLYKELVGNHYFADGNKRIGILIAYLFLNKNGFKFDPSKGDIYSVTISIAKREIPFEEINDWFQKYSKKKD
ncbi:MAG: type II toxin-antitoxin system death-on-curing family toxin [Candidatus Heimdallarchaeota archaeon]|nr:type II toxin-antitoxin system death-on-curing family toxin [Candidatus Heimdallarchaeota archaeon]